MKWCQFSICDPVPWHYYPLIRAKVPNYVLKHKTVRYVDMFCGNDNLYPNIITTPSYPKNGWKRGRIEERVRPRYVLTDTRIVFSRMQPLPGISSLNILMRFHLLLFLKNILILFVALKPRIYLVYMILWASDISFNWEWV